MDTKKLRQKILDLAIRGKLVPQDPNDEPASVLLERIRAEKERLIKEGKIKRSKKSASDTPHYENQEPFEVPISWEWVRLDSIGDIVTGSTPPKDNKELYGGHIPFYKPTDLEQGINTTTSTDSLTEEGFAVARQLPTDSILVTCIGATIGKTGMIRKAGTCNQQINAIVSFPGIFPDYIYYVCISDFMQSKIKDNASATTLPILNKNHFAELRIPLPPIEEQKRIVAAIEKWFSLIDTLESAKEDLRTSIEHTKSKILDLAIHGKLVPQDPNDEPAIELLKRLNSKYTPCDNAHKRKQIPDSWIWCTLQDTFKITMGSSPTGDTLNRKKLGIEFHQGKVFFSNKYILPSDIYSTQPVKLAEPLSILLCVRAPVGTVNITDRQICIGRGLCSLIPSKSIDLQYAYYVMQTCSEELEQKATGSTFKAVGGDVVKNQIIPLPSINEQRRIVAKIEELFAVLDEIKESLEA